LKLFSYLFNSPWVTFSSVVGIMYHVCTISQIVCPLAQQVVPTSVLPITEILTIENYKLDDAFFYVAFGSQSRLRTTSVLTRSNTNSRTEEAIRGGGEREPNKILT
jgi:hypothetical protein